MLKPRRKVPDVIRRGLRLTIGLAICNSLGFFLGDSLGALEPKLEHNIVQGAKWASITCIVVSAPVTGRVAQVSLERTLGTVSGGLLGFFAYVFGHNISNMQDEVFLVIATSLVGFMSVLLGRWLHLDYSAKLYVMTFVLVVMAADRSAEAAMVAATRILGICFGVMCSVALSVVIFPKSANCEAVDNMALALQDLSAFLSLAWSGGRTEDGPGMGNGTPVKRKRKKTDAYIHIGTTEEYTGGMSDKDRRELECEKLARDDIRSFLQVLMDVYSKLGACEGFLKDAASEVYCTTIRGRWCFLPGIMWLTLGRWRLPKDEMLEVATAIRKVARVLWSMHTLFQEGFHDPAMMALLEQYPPDLMSQLQQTSYAAVQDLLTAFPDKRFVDSSHLHRFVQGYQVLIKTADWHRRRMAKWVRAGLSRTPEGSQQTPDYGEPPAPSPAIWGSPSDSDRGLELEAEGDGLSLPVAIERSYQAMKGLSPPLLRHGSGSLHTPPRGSWAGQMQIRANGSSDNLSEDVRTLIFPETTAGHISEVRWYSFQFIMAQLADELSDMHNAMARLLIKFPHTALATPESGASTDSGSLGDYHALAAEELGQPLRRTSEISGF